MEYGKAVVNPLIQYVVDTRNGASYSLTRFVERELRRVDIARGWLLDRLHTKPWLLCPHCETAVYLVSSVKSEWFFRHRVEDGSCPHVTRGALSQDAIDAIRYDGQKEGPRHRRMKQLIYRSLKADSRFSEPLIEKRWRGTRVPGKYRQPDVQSTLDHSAHGALRIAFEAQLSTTYINVIRERRDFYRRDGGLLFWIFTSFDPELRRQYQDDVFFPNNSNLFAIDEETTALSEEHAKLHLRCHYCVPEVVEGTIQDQWRSEVVSVDRLTINRPRQQMFFFDYSAARAALETLRIQQADEELRRDFEEFWEDTDETEYNFKQRIYAGLVWRLKQRGIALQEIYSFHSNIGVMARLLYTAKRARMVGLGFKKLVEVGHYADNFDIGRRFLLPFGWLCKRHGTQLQDASGLWLRRRKRIRASIKRGDPAYSLDADLVPVMCFLFPEIAEQITRWQQARAETI